MCNNWLDLYTSEKGKVVDDVDSQVSRLAYVIIWSVLRPRRCLLPDPPDLKTTNIRPRWQCSPLAICCADEKASKLKSPRSSLSLPSLVRNAQRRICGTFRA